ncbi:transposase family protein [Streptomyces sp. NPDC059008]|uniref:transposase family protein n=1 Tax=Streptomyces sp. NPDC059008 TaxID=3346693 RepID=UPI0036A43025
MCRRTTSAPHLPLACGGTGSVDDLVTRHLVDRFARCAVQGGLRRLLPHLSEVGIDSIQRCTDGVALRTLSRTPSVPCPHCGRSSTRVHGRYERRLVDAPLGGLPIVITLLIRRFNCLAADCPAVTFAEQIPGLTRPHARYTPVMRG